jgi:sugar lactone lactonase YvrE
MFKKTFFITLIVNVLIIPVFATPGDTLKTYPAPGKCPTGLAFDGKNLWVADRLSDTLYALDPANGKTVTKLASPGFIPVGLAWDGKNLWLADAEEKKIHKIESSSGKTLLAFDTPTENPRGLAWDGSALWMSDDIEDKVMQISADDGTMIKSFTAPSGSPQGLTWDGKYLWCADRITNRIYMIEVKWGEVLLSIDAPGPHARGIAWDNGFLWCADYQTDRIYKLVVEDEAQVKISNSKLQELTLTHEFRNYGPGKIASLDIYLAIPVDRVNQRIMKRIVYSPEPHNDIFDRWGQEFSAYHFENLGITYHQRESMTVVAELSDARWFVFPEKVGAMSDIPLDILSKYLKDEDKYRIDDPVIQKAVKEAVGDETSPYWILRRIYKYVRDHMKYELSGGWNVAPAVLTRGNGSCSEYSFVFIAMCRAAGLPAKYVGSVAIRGDDASTDDVFHRWCECYLPNYGWVPVDPSGGDQDSPSAVAEYFGFVANRYLITTDGGGNSEYLGWEYNAFEKWTAQGPVKVYIEKVGEWSPGRR